MAAAKIDSLWVLQERYGDAVDALWQKQMTRAVNALKRRSIKTTAQATKALNATQKVAKAFGKSKPLTTLTHKAHRDSYAVGSLIIEQRDEEIRENGKLPPRADGASLRVNREVEVEKAKVAVPKSITAEFSFTAADTAAIRELDKQALVWFRSVDGAPYFDVEARAAIIDSSTQLIATGKSGTQVAAALAADAERLYGVGKFTSKGQSYWAGVAEHAATTAGIRGQLETLQQIGWTRYEIVNPSDERTTDICSHLNGKIAFVEHAIELEKRLGGESTVEGIKDVKPFASGGKTTALPFSPSIGSRELTSKESKSLADSGFSYPPYHFRCRSYIDISFNEGDVIP